MVKLIDVDEDYINEIAAIVENIGDDWDDDFDWDWPECSD